MFPLLHKDGLTIPLISLAILFLILLHVFIHERPGDDPVIVFTENLELWASQLSALAAISVLGMAFLCGLHLGWFNYVT